MSKQVGVKLLRSLARRVLDSLLWNPAGMAYLRTAVPNQTAVGWGMEYSDEAAVARISQRLQSLGIDVVPYRVSLVEREDWVQRARYDNFPYRQAFQDPNIFLEKSLEHFLAAQWLQLSPADVYIDIASLSSPAAEIYHNLYGCTAYRQDLVFPEGLHGDTIGGDAAEMPVPDGFANKMALHCSFEHFEGDTDVRFIKKAARVLQDGGKLVIVPLYLAERFAIHSNPAAWVRRRIPFDSGATVHWVRQRGLIHARGYDPEHFFDRVVRNSFPLSLTVFRIDDLIAISPAYYVRFGAVFERKR